MATERLDVTVAEDNGATARLTAAVERLATAADTLQGASDRSAGATRRAGDAAANSANQHNTLQRAMGGATNSFNLLASAAGAFGVTLSIKGLIDYADGFTAIQNRLKLVTKNHTELAAATKEVFRVSQETRTSVQTNAGIYARLTDSLKSMNRSTAEAAPLLKTLTQAVQLSGSGTQTAAAGLEQLQQAFGSGTLRGQEFNSVMLNINAVAKVIADGLGKPIGQLRALAQAGQLSSKVVIDALQKQASVVDRAFAQTSFSITSAIVVFNNAMTMYVGQSNSASSATGLLTRSILFFADNINVVAPILAGFIALLALGTIAGAVSAIATLTGQIFALGAAAITAAIGLGTTLLIPIGLLAVAALATYGAFKMWGDYLVKLTTDIPILGAAVAYLNSLINGNKTATDLAKDAKSGFKSVLDETFTSIGTYTGGVNNSTKSLYNTMNAAREAGKEYNQFGEEINKAAGHTEHHTRSTMDGGAAVARYAGATVNGTGAVKNWGGANDNARGSVDRHKSAIEQLRDRYDDMIKYTDAAKMSLQDVTAAFNQGSISASQYMNRLQEIVTASNQIVGTIDLLERYGNVGQAAFDKISGAASRASSSMGSAAASAGRNDAAGGYSVNGQIKGYQDSYAGPTGGGGELPSEYKIERNGRTLTTVIPQFESGPRGFSYDVGWKAYNLAKNMNAAVQLIDKYKPGLTNAEVQGMLSAVANNLDAYEAAWAAEARAAERSGTGAKATGGSAVGQQGGGMRAFATGGQFMVGGRGGTDSQQVRFKASPNERVTVETPAQQRRNDREKSPSAPMRAGPITNIIQLAVKDTDSVRKTRRQGYQDLLRDISRKA